MKKIWYIFGAAVLAIIVTGVFAPKSKTVERKIVIEKPVEEVFTYLVSLKNMVEYSPWQAKDPNATHVYTGVGNTVGSVHRWESDVDEVGVGEQEIKSITPNKEVVSELRFEKPFESTSTGYFKFQPVAKGTEVTWGYTGDLGFVESVFMLFMDMEKVLGPDFEKGLADAKTILEK
ncbi:SRPBCC family protein [Wenyingzhuangia sp. IMCC45574]